MEMKSTEQHYFDLGKSVGRSEFNRKWFINGIVIGLQFGLTIYLLSI